MAIAFGAAGTAANGTTSCSPAYPSPAAGNPLFLVTSSKYAYANTPTGWTLLGQANGGAGASGVDSGNAYVCIFQKYAVGNEGTTTVSVSVTSGNSVRARIFSYTGRIGVWSFSASVGSDNTAGTSWSVTGDVDPGIVTDDMVIVGSAVNSDAQTFSSQAMTTTGVTYGAANEREDTGTANGDDLRLVVSDHAVSSGTSSAAPVYTMTASGTSGNRPAGASVMIRMREPTIGCKLHTANASGTDGTTFTTASVTLAVGNTYYLGVSGYQVAGATSSPTVSGWTQVDEISLLSTPSFGKLNVFKKAGDASTGTHTIDYGAVTMDSCAWTMIEATGFDTETNVSKFASTTDGGVDSDPLSVTYGSAFASASNFALAFFFTQNGRNPTPRTGWYQPSFQTPSDYSQAHEVQIKTSSDTIASVDWDYGNWDCVIALELPIPTGSYVNVDPYGRNGYYGI